MTKLKKFAMVVTVVGILGMAGAAYAATIKTPAEIVSDLTGKTVENLNEERAAGKTYGAIANEAGKLEEFKVQMLEQKKEILDQRVEDGRITQERADEIYNTMKDNQADCDGTGSAAGGKCGAGLGQGCSMSGRGTGMRNGAGMGRGNCINR